MRWIVLNLVFLRRFDSKKMGFADVRIYQNAEALSRNIL